MKRILLMPFYKIAAFILDRIRLERLVRNGRKLEEDLKAVKGRVSIKDYYMEKIALLLAAAFWGTGLILFTALATGREINWIKGSAVSRPGYGEEKRETELDLYVGEEDRELSVPVTITPRKMNQKQLENFFRNALNQLEEVVPGKNKSLDEVRMDLKLVSELDLNQVSISVDWTVEPSGLMNDEGIFQRQPKKEGELLSLKAVLSCQGQEMEYKFFARAYPKSYTQMEELLLSAEKEVEEADGRAPYEGELKLPDKIGGTSVRWASQKEPIIEVLAFLLLAVLAAIFVGKDRELAKAAGLRRQQLEADYPSMVFKLTMLLGAGLTTRAAFTKVAEEGTSRDQKQKRAVYQEMLITCREMERGIPEAEAYEGFGRRCQVAVYGKLGSVLAQNLKKGSKGLVPLLEQEAYMSLEERRAMIKKLGEEAGTKLLLPMMLMLVVVLVILMVPAVMSF